MIEISRFFDESAVLKHVQALSFSRKASTIGEKKAINYIQNELADENIKNRAESFEWCDHSILKPLFLFNAFSILIYELILLLLFEIKWLLLLFSLLIIIFCIIIVEISINPNQFSFIGKKKKSRNVIGEIPAQNKRFKRPMVIFSAHYESTNHKYPLRLQMFLSFLNFFLMIIYLITIFSIFIASALAFEIHESIKLTSLIIGIIFIIILILSFFNKKIDDSNNLINSLSGSAILIELAKFIKKDPLDHIDVIFLWTGAEKFGLWGIRNYCQKHFFELYEEYELDDSYNFNIDKIGNKIGLVEKIGFFKCEEINQNLNAIIKASAKNMNVKIIKVNMPRIIPQHFEIFKSYSRKVRKELQLSCFSYLKIPKLERGKERFLNDILKQNLNNCLNVCFNTIKSLDKRIE
ncbi:MAG: M28 family peptidase [Promethearchaeota archaeon]